MKLMNTLKRYGAKASACALPLMFAGAALADDPGFTPPTIDFGPIIAWISGALAVGVIGVALSMKGVELSKRGISKI